MCFVTAFYDHQNQNPYDQLQYKLDCIKLLSEIIEIHVFCPFSLKSLLDPCKNIHIHLFELYDTWIYKASLPYMGALPLRANPKKDSFFHLVHGHLKAFWLYQLTLFCPDAKHYVWIDCNIPHILSDPHRAIKNLSNTIKLLNKNNNILSLLIPGIIPKTQINLDPDNVCWRFCGNLLIGNKDGIQKLMDFYNKSYQSLLVKQNKLSWETNFWAQAEDELDIQWWPANHDDSIVKIPYVCILRKIIPKEMPIKYDYPLLPGFNPSSASYIFYEGKHILVTRYVNYKIDSNGFYVIPDKDRGQLRTENVISFLSQDFTSLLESYLLNDLELGLKTIDDRPYTGLEDMRLYIDNDNQLCFVASSGGYTTNKISIIQGCIDVPLKKTQNGRILKGHQPCEKNWIPIQKNNINCFIYKWQPFTVISMDTMEKLVERLVPYSVFDHVRGSTVPVWSAVDNCFICVVHISDRDEHGKLKYYHMLVKLEAETYDIIGWSNLFYFRKWGIQYCIGFTIVNDNEYCFWYSEDDGNPGFMCSCSSDFAFALL